FVILTLAVVPSADALSIRLDATGGAVASASVTINDGGAGDTSALAGAIVYSGSVGAWDFIVTAGLSKPASGTATSPAMQLTIFANSTNSVATTLDAWLSETSFGPSGPTVNVNWFGGGSAI